MKRHPLEHIRIVDLTQAWAGSYALQLLGDFGADIIKIESRSRPDPWRGGFEAGKGIPAYPTSGPGDRPYNRSYLANSVNRNKRAITLDLNSSDGVEIFLNLVRDADVVAENFTPRVMNNLGIGFQVLRSVRPSIILLSMPAFGLSGPYSDFPGIGGTIEPMSGNSWLLGESPGQPQVSGVMYPDAVAGLNGAGAVLAALQHREATGEGVHMEVSQHESMIAMLGEFFAQDAAVESFPYRNSDLICPLNAIFATLGQENWIALTARDNEQLRVLAEIVGVTPNHDGAVDANQVEAATALWIRSRTAEEVERCLGSTRLAVGRVRSMSEVLACPQLNAGAYWQLVEQPEEIGPMPMPGPIARLSVTPGGVRLPPARHGEHSREVLVDQLGIPSDTFAELVSRGITGEGPPP